MRLFSESDASRTLGEPGFRQGATLEMKRKGISCATEIALLVRDRLDGNFAEWFQCVSRSLAFS